MLDIIYEIRTKIRNDSIQFKYHSSNTKDCTDKINELKNYCRNIVNNNNNICNDLYELNKNINNFINNCCYGNADSLKQNNIVDLLLFMHKDISIFEDFCKEEFQNYLLEEKSIKLINNFLNNIEYDKYAETISSTIAKYYSFLPENQEYTTWEEYTPKFQFKNVFNKTIDTIINRNRLFNKKVYNNLINIDGLEHHIKERLRNRLNSLFSPMKISKNGTTFTVEVLDFNKIDYYSKEEVKNKILDNIDLKNDFVSRIVEFEYLINDIKNKEITMSHPSNFEDCNENKYDDPDKKYLLLILAEL